ncbi:MAG: hypothetical protein MMC23_006388 [Stictis urceolatum]|nr:hypothetical protein [Stictis urceolata]
MANQRPFDFGDFISAQDVSAYANMYPGHPFADPDEGSSRHSRSHHRRRPSQSPSTSRSRSRSRSRPRKGKAPTNVPPPPPPDYDEDSPPTPPEEIPNQDYFHNKRPHAHPHHPYRHSQFHHQHPHPPPPLPPGQGHPGHPGHPGAHIPPPPAPNMSPDGPPSGSHPELPHGPWGPWSGPRGPHGGPKSRGHGHGHGHGPGHHGHGRGGFGGRGRGRGWARGGRGAFPNMFAHGPWSEMLNNSARGEMGGLNMKDLAGAFAEQFGWVDKAEERGKGKGAKGEGEGEDVEVDFEPAVDVFVTEEAFVVHVSLPGAKKEDVGVTWDEGRGELMVQGVLTRGVEEGMMECLEVSEREVGLFRKVVRLSGEGEGSVDPDDLNGKMEEGVLVVRVGKKVAEEEFVKVKKVDIQ